MRLQAVDFERFLYATGLLAEADVAWAPGGGNELVVADDTFKRLDAEQLTELAGAVTNVVPTVSPEPTAVPPPGAADGSRAPQPAGDEPPARAARTGAKKQPAKQPAKPHHDPVSPVGGA